MITLNIEEIQDLDLSDLCEYLNSDFENFFKSKKSYYKLLRYLSSKFNDEIILDIGTCTGSSAISLATNNNHVITFDITDEHRFSFKNLSITPVICSVTEISDDLIESSPLIFLDVAHNGDEELEFYNRLLKLDYKGILILDDIRLNYRMDHFWKQIVNNKYDLTDFFHESGTGIVDFSKQLTIKICSMTMVPE